METKPGYKTTEFWLTMLVTFANVLNLTSIWDMVPNKYAVIGQAIVTALYAVSRGQAKQGIPYKPPVSK